ncbi:Uu.00g048220.m01.CDS01 [Anthostomella pinea]|uniref:Uu.00g048220.m01.CDS01 n=1 Tax=Anthostomella pinea TaxID=933095 RepID=A0AAI8VBK4_9PEZI|nr:Uu.00g048220.m01.CDS01 [Anthostomella pinea]
MSMATQRLLPQGIYTPIPTFFDEDEELDLKALSKHIHFTASAGTIPVVAGSAGEAAHLSPSERTLLIKTTRAALDEAGLPYVPIVAGVGAPSTRETMQLARQAAVAGADFVMVIPPGFYAAALQENRGEALRAFFVDVAEASALPVIVYNFPAVSGGIDLDSDLIVDVVRRSPNIVGVKLTTCVRLWELSNSPAGSKAYAEAQELQGKLALADGFMQKIGFAGMKMLLHKLFGYGPLPRRPLQPSSFAAGDDWLMDPWLCEVLAEEKRLGLII